MIDLTGASQGSFGDGVWFSDLYAKAAQSNLTGGILVHGTPGDAAVFFRDGRPVHAAGSGFTKHFLGALLVEMNACTQEQVDAVVAQQSEMPNPALLGTLLVSEEGVNPADIKRVIQKQNEARMGELFGWPDGQWQAAPGENARIRDIGVITPGWPLFFEALGSSASDDELRYLADQLLGRAVKLRGPGLGLGDYEPNRVERKLLHYLEKPRRPDHLERALRNRRAVRGFLRALSLLGKLDLLPAAQGVGIPKASLLKSVDLPGVEQVRATAEAKKREQSAAHRAAMAPRRKSPIVREVETLHGQLQGKSHFEILGATEKTPTAELRKLYTDLAKKFHPDAFPPDAEPAAAVKAREVSARINEAYETLSSEEKRAQYMVLLNDKRIRGDTRRAEKVREAEMKSKMAAVVLRRREYKQAREMFKHCMELDPETGVYKAHFAWAIFADPNYDRSKAVGEAKALVQEALDQVKDSSPIHFYMAQILKSEHQDRDALHHFKQALRFDRKNADALSEIRLLEMRQQKRKEDESGAKGLVSRLFKPK